MSQAGENVSTRATNRQIVSMRVLKSLRYTRLLALTLVSTGGVAWGQAQKSEPTSPGRDLTQVSIESLMNMEVTSVSKKEQKLSRIASAIFVITQEDIRTSGATNLPDVLRLVPGLDVAQINGNAWEISSRGFNAQYADKLLVLIDGRTVYSPVFAGVYWDVQDVPLEDIDRIEVIRGPGATVWGANAVNGVINIITKSAKETLGGLLTAGGGTHEPGFGVAQYGGNLSQATGYRLFVKGFDYNSFPSLSGQSGHDGFNLLHGGFRVDSTLSKQDSLTVQGDLYEGHEEDLVNNTILTPPFGEVFTESSSLSGGNVLGRWNHTFSPHSDTSLQVYFDRAARNSILYGESTNTSDIDFQHHISWGSRQDFVWGAGYRYISYATTGSVYTSFNPASGGFQLFTSFVQDEITLKPDSLARLRRYRRNGLGAVMRSGAGSSRGGDRRRGTAAAQNCTGRRAACGAPVLRLLVLFCRAPRGHRIDSARDERGSRKMFECGDGRVSDEAYPAAGVG
jgi:iron complex outermembrane recepter protein